MLVDQGHMVLLLVLDCLLHPTCYARPGEKKGDVRL